jgi:HEPN domain-containing protein
MLFMAYMDNNPAYPDKSKQDDLERLLLQGLGSQEQSADKQSAVPAFLRSPYYDESNASLDSDVQGSLGLYAEAAQDAATASVELALGRHFACADYCNQAVEKAAQAVSLFRQGHRTMYDHDLRALATVVGAPPEVQEEMALLTPFHPEAFYAQTPPEEADDALSAEQASEYVQVARRVLRWAKGIIL